MMMKKWERENICEEFNHTLIYLYCDLFKSRGARARMHTALRKPSICVVLVPLLLLDDVSDKLPVISRSYSIDVLQRQCSSHPMISTHRSDLVAVSLVVRTWQPMLVLEHYLFFECRSFFLRLVRAEFAVLPKTSEQQQRKKWLWIMNDANVAVCARCELVITRIHHHQQYLNWMYRYSSMNEDLRVICLLLLCRRNCSFVHKCMLINRLELLIYICEMYFVSQDRALQWGIQNGSDRSFRRDPNLRI